MSVGVAWDRVLESKLWRKCPHSSAPGLRAMQSTEGFHQHCPRRGSRSSDALVAISIPSAKILSSKYHYLLKGNPDLLVVMADVRVKYEMSLE